MEPTPSEREPSQDVLVAGDVVLDLPAHQVWAGGQPIHLSHLEFVALTTLARAGGKAVSPSELAEILAEVTTIGPRTVTSVLSRLRERLGSGPSRPDIVVTRGRGYHLVVLPA